MRIYLTSCLLFLSIISSCQKSNKYSTQLAVADTLVRALYAYDTIKVNNMIGVNHEDIGEDREHYQFKLETAKKMLQKTGLPKREDFTIKEYPKTSADMLDVTVALKASGQSITIRFVKFLPENKIAFFQLDGPMTIESTITPPDSKN